LLDQERLFNNANHQPFYLWRTLKIKLFNAEIYASSVAMTQKGQWLTDLEALAKKEPWKVLFVKAPAANKHNLSQDWFDRMRDNAPSEMHYDAEIRNIRPKKTTNGFYPHWIQRKHYYAYDNDYLPDRCYQG
jgi:hypothetical protein